METILFMLAVIPVIVICTYIYRKDKNKEPGSLLVKLFLLGIVSCFLVLLLSEVVFTIFPFMNKGTENMNFLEVTVYSFIGVALIEEFCKWIMTYKGAYSNRAYDEVYDGIVYAVYVSLGFAFFENLLYVFGNGSIAVGISRGLLAVPGHACDAVFMGYYLSLAKVYSHQGRKDLEKKNLVLSVLIPTILHGVYDFCLFSQIDILLLVFFIFVITIYILSIKKIKQLSEQSKSNNQYSTPTPNNYNNPVNYQQSNYEPQYAPSNNINFKTTTPPQVKNNFCPNCGTAVTGNFCSNCGTRQN